jgi:hypothetical protein
MKLVTLGNLIKNTLETEHINIFVIIKQRVEIIAIKHVYQIPTIVSYIINNK